MEVLIAAGGDGTVKAVARGLLGTSALLGIIPVGTMNNLARSLEIPEEIDAACAIISAGRARTIDVGMINNHVFLEVAGAGLETLLFPPAEDIKRPGLLSSLRGAFKGLLTLLTYEPPLMYVSFGGGLRRAYRALQVTICNTPTYGLHLKVAPEARVDDGLLDVVIYRNFSKIEYIQHAIAFSQGVRLLTPRIRRRRVRTLRIVAEPPVEIQADGEPLGSTPAEVRVLPGALRVLAPPAPEPAGRRRRTSRVSQKMS